MKEKEENINDRMIQLIIDSLSGILSPDEEFILQQWLSESEANERLFREIVETWKASELLDDMKQYDAKKALAIVKQKINKKRGSRYYISLFQKVAAVLFLPLLLASVVLTTYFLNKNSDTRLVWQKIHCPVGTRSEVKLPDGTSVWLNGGGELSFPTAFATNERKVKVSGEAFFDVVSNPSSPFLVDLNDVTVKVTGTCFNVQNYIGSQDVVVSLQEGKIELYKGKEVDVGSYLAGFTPGDKVRYYKDKQTIEKSYIDPQYISSWKDGVLRFQDETVYEVAERLGRWYNVFIKADPESDWDDFLLTATFENESLTQVLDIMKHSNSIDYKFKDTRNEDGQRTIIIYMPMK